MARAVKKSGRVYEIVSTPLEEYFDVPFKVVGSQKWIDSLFEAGALKDHEKLYVSKRSHLDPVRSWMADQPVLGVDTETTGEDKRSGLDPWREGSRMLIAQIGTSEMVWIIQPELLEYLRDILEDENKIHMGHNLVYDFKYILAKYNIHMNNFYDTMLAEQLLTSGLYGIRVGLADLARRYPPHRMISKETRHDFVHFKERGEKISRRMAYYAARDVVLLFPIMEQQKKDLERWKLERVAQDEFNIIPCTAMMELGGVQIDQDTLRHALSYWEFRREELEQQILDIYDAELTKLGKKEMGLLGEIKQVFDVDSQAQKLQALQSLGLELDDVKRDTLEDLDHPIAVLLAEYSNVTKITSTYGENMLRRVNPASGKLHPEFNQLGSGDMEEKRGRAKKGTIATGRYSSDFQQLPKPVERYAAVLAEDVDSVAAAFADQLLTQEEVAV